MPDAFLYLACTPSTSLVIHSSCNIGAFPFHSVLLQLSIYVATCISSYFCPLNVSIQGIDFPLWISPLLFWNLIISWDNFHISSSCLWHILAHISAQFWMCCRWCNAVIFASIWGKLISVCVRHSSRGRRFPEQHIPGSIALMQWPLSEKGHYSEMAYFYFFALFAANRSATWPWMEASAPGQAGPHVVIMMEAAQGPVCVGHEPVITPPLSVEASSATASAWRSPTAPGKLFWRQHPICLHQQFINTYSVLLCQEDGTVWV